MQSRKFWTFIEHKMKCIVPMYIRNLLACQGFDCIAAIKNIVDDDIQHLEMFAKSEEYGRKIPKDADREQFYGFYHDAQDRFEIVRGHKVLLREIVKFLSQESTEEDFSLLEDQQIMQQSGRRASTSQIGIGQANMSEDEIKRKPRRSTLYTSTAKEEIQLKKRARVHLESDIGTPEAKRARGRPKSTKKAIAVVQPESENGTLDAKRALGRPKGTKKTKSKKRPKTLLNADATSEPMTTESSVPGHESQESLLANMSEDETKRKSKRSTMYTSAAKKEIQLKKRASLQLESEIGTPEAKQARGRPKGTKKAIAVQPESENGTLEAKRGIGRPKGKKIKKTIAKSKKLPQELPKTLLNVDATPEPITTELSVPGHESQKSLFNDDSSGLGEVSK